MIAIAAGEYEVRTGLRQSAGQILAETAAGAGHNGYSAAEIEKSIGHGSVFMKRFPE